MVTSNGFRDGRFQLAKQGVDAVDYRDHIGAGLALDVENDRRGRVHPSGLTQVLRAIDDGGHVFKPHRGAVFISDDDGLIASASEDLIIGADDVRLLDAVEIAFGLVDVGLVERSAQILHA